MSRADASSPRDPTLSGDVHLRLQRIVDAALDAVITVDHAGNILEFNPAAERIFGFKASEVIGQPMADRFIPPVYRQAHDGFGDPLTTSRSSMPGRRIELVATRADGTEFPCELSIARLDVAGQPIFTAFVRDITDRRRVEDELRRTSEQLEQLVNHRTVELTRAVLALERAQEISRTGSIELDLETGDRTWSPEMFRLFELDPANGVPSMETLLDRIHPDDRAQVGRIIAEASRGALWDPFDCRVVLADGRVRWVRSAGSHFVNPLTGHLTLSTTLQDISDRKEVELALARTSRRLVRAQAVARVGFVDIDRRRGSREWSPQMFELFGFPLSPEPPTLGQMLDRIHPEDRPRVQAIIDRSYATGELAGSIEYRIVLPDGRLRWVSNVAQHEDGNVNLIMSTYLDITDLKLAEEAEARRSGELAAVVRHLEQTRERLERAQDLARMGDAERVVGTPHRVWSRQLYQLHGFDPRDGVPDREAFLSRIHPDDVGTMIEYLRKADAGEAIPPFEYRVVLPVGDTRWLRVQSKTTIDPETRAVRIASSTIDVSEQKAAEREMLRALDRERELGKLKADFLHMVTHEYRTPLGIIVTATDILDRHLDRLAPGDRHERLRDIRSSALRLAGLMEEILFLGKTEAGAVPLELRALDFAAVIREIIREVTPLHGASRDVRVQLADVPAGAQADEKLLRHILTNLLSNALKYSPADKPVSIDLHGDAGELRFVVRDEGIGIPEADQPAIFDMFRRAGNVGTISGTGLGLVVVKRCVELHRGHIELRSAADRGTEVTVHLPLTISPLPRA